jgi:hypothetical protein
MIPGICCIVGTVPLFSQPTTISAMEKTDIEKTKITSPTIRFVTYNLRHTILILIPHLHRHINQAVRVKLSENFPHL